ncbi:ciliary microtubule inner protein 5 [Menidia menidia]
MAEAKDPDRNDAVKEDQLWKVMVWKEKKAAQEWEKNWSCLLEGDAKGVKEPLPDSVSVFSDRFPSTSSRAVGGAAGHASGPGAGAAGPAALGAALQPGGPENTHIRPEKHA